MCGIVGIVSSNPFSIRGHLLQTLKRLESRGYDSVGYATNQHVAKKSAGHIDDFSKTIGGTAATAHKICNYPSYIEIKGFELMKKITEQVKKLDVPTIISIHS